jgi:hypothetical protein
MLGAMFSPMPGRDAAISGGNKRPKFVARMAVEAAHEPHPPSSHAREKAPLPRHSPPATCSGPWQAR